jgi:hypothetical protein
MSSCCCGQSTRIGVSSVVDLFTVRTYGDTSHPRTGRLVRTSERPAERIRRSTASAQSQPAIVSQVRPDTGLRESELASLDDADVPITPRTRPHPSRSSYCRFLPYLGCTRYRSEAGPVPTPPSHHRRVVIGHQHGGRPVTGEGGETGEGRGVAVAGRPGLDGVEVAVDGGRDGVPGRSVRVLALRAERGASAGSDRRRTGQRVRRRAAGSASAVTRAEVCSPSRT